MFHSRLGRTLRELACSSFLEEWSGSSNDYDWNDLRALVRDFPGGSTAVVPNFKSRCDVALGEKPAAITSVLAAHITFMRDLKPGSCLGS